MKRHNHFWLDYSATLQALLCILIGTLIACFATAFYSRGGWQGNFAFLVLWALSVFGCYFLRDVIAVLISSRRKKGRR